MARFFFALDICPLDKHKINQCCGQYLSPYISEFKLITPENYHITLAFLGEVTESQINTLCRHAESLAKKLSPISHAQLTFDHLGLFKKPQVLYLSLNKLGLNKQDVAAINENALPSWLSILADQLKNKALALALFQEDREYTPHISIARKAKNLPDIAINSLTIKIKSFSLYQSISTANGVQYVPVKQWSLL